MACRAAGDGDVAARLAERAQLAQGSGETVRAYLLYAEACKRDPKNPRYLANRDALAWPAKLLTDSHIENADIAGDIRQAERDAAEAKPPLVPALAPRPGEILESSPHIKATTLRRSFNLRGDEVTLFQQVATSYGLRVAWDPQLVKRPNIQFQLDDVDLKTALEALTAVTDTFVFPLSADALFFARDTEIKRNDLEPTILLTFHLPDAVDEKELIEAANSVRSMLLLRSFGWDSTNRTVLIRDRPTRARIGRSLLEALLRPKAQVALEVEILTLDEDTSTHYGAALQTAFQLIDFGHINHFQSILQTATTAMNFATFGAGSTLIGVGIANATVFATYTKSYAHASYDATLIGEVGVPANLHIGEKYPIPQTLYSGAAKQGGASLYNPIGQITLEDLGLVLKMTPRVNGDGDVALDLEAEFKALGTQTFNTVPAISQRKFAGSVNLREDEWAVIAGLQQNSTSVSRQGLAGIVNVPGLNQALSDNNRSRSSSNTLIVIKPRVLRLPASPALSPQYLLGTSRGPRVAL
jgi:general secretion pathway protein D